MDPTGGAANGANGTWPSNNATSLPMRPRLPTVDDALQYSPLSSITPFDPDIIPFPSAFPRPPNTIFTHAEERQKARKGLESLNAEAANANPQSTSYRLQQSLQQLQRLLRPQELTEYKFKRPTQAPSTQNNSNGTLQKAQTPRLGAFSNMVLNNTNVAFRYPSPSPTPTPKAKSLSKRADGPQFRQPAQHRRPPAPVTQSHTSQTTPQAIRQNDPLTPIKTEQPEQQVLQHNRSSANQNGKVAVVIPAKSSQPKSAQPRVEVRPQPKVEVRQQPVVEVRPQPTVHVSVKQQPSVEVRPAPPGSEERQAAASVVIPGLPPSSQKDQYQAYPDFDARVLAGEDGASKKRKRDDEAEAAALTMSVDQRQKIQAAVMNLQNLIGDIFEAEDQLQPDTSGVISSDAAKLFIPNHVADSELPVLAPQVQFRLDSALYKVISAKAFGNIPADNLSRLQKLCEGAVSGVSSLSIILGEDWSEDDIEEWVGRLNRAEHGLQAARILLRIMTAGREEKQLYSEDLLSNILDALKHVLETCMIPVIEARNSESGSTAFKILSAQRKPLTSLLQMAGKVLRLLSEMIVKVDVSESAITSVEFLSTTLIFVENAPNEKDSALGIQRCEAIRRIAMDVLAKIFARYPDQRTFIFDEILTSLEKLPVTRQSARQFKMADGKPIQLVSALLMRLIQTSATRSIRDTHKDVQGLRLDDAMDDEDNASQTGARSPAPDQSGIIDMDDAVQMDREDLIQELNVVMKPLFEDAQKSTRYLVNFMVQRAMTATKTGDQPYRNLLDIFTEDFLNVLGSPDWPAAELLLRALLSNMISLAENDKSAAPAKNMALDLMGLMGSGILDLQLHVKSAARNLDTSESDLSRKLVNMAEDIMDDKFEDAELLEFDGPYRIVLEYLKARDLNDPQLQSAQGYHLTQWAKEVHSFLDKDDDENIRGTLAVQLRNMILDPKWLEQEFDFENIVTSQGNLGGYVVALRLPFCKAFKRMFGILLSAMASDQATVKSKSLKSVVQLLEKDPSILKNGNYIINQILRCASDQSPLVRDSALGLLGKCLQFKPSLEYEVFDRIIARAQDAAVGVRKRAMKLLKDIYLRNDSKDVKTAIAEALLQRVRDADDSVSELARTTFEEIWFTPFHATNKMERAQSKLLLQNQVTLIIKTVQRGESVLSVLDALLENVLSTDSKHHVANFNVCKTMVALMFDGVIDSTELPESPSQQHILQTLTVFARANPKLFTGEQLQLLQPYVQNLSNTDDLLIYRSVIVIFRHTLPSLSSLQNTFLKAVQDALLSSVSKLGKMELNEVAQCLWIIDGVLQNTERLVRLTISVINGVHASKETKFSEDTPQATQAQNRVKRYMMIAGYFGKSCDFDPHAATFKEKFSWWKGSSVAGLIVDVIKPFTRQKIPHTLREMAFESIGMICQAWPIQFLRADVTTAFELVFHNRDTKLEQIVLSAFKTFFAKQEQKSESGAQIKVGQGAARGSERLEVSLIASDDDGACSGIAQRFLQHIVRIALEPAEELAMTATQVIASINRQGLVHPKECGPALVALETSTNQFVANIAFQEHRTLHQKHESMFEKEYMKAVQQAFTYQQEIFNDVHGATSQPFAPKLRSLFEVLKTGNSKVRKKFLVNLSAKADFDFSKLDTSADLPYHLLYARFCLENLAFFDYVRVDELLSLISNMEKIVSNTGTPVAHAIELEVLKVRLDEPAAPPPLATSIETFDPMMPPSMDQSMQQFPQLQPQQPLQQPFLNGEMTEQSLDVAPERLKHLAVASIILTMVWETRTYLRRLWGLQKQRDGGKSTNKPTIKDLNKAPSRQPFVVPDKYWEKMLTLMDSFHSTDAMVAQCKAFAELLSIDNELKIASEDDEEAEMMAKAAGYETPDDDEESRGGSQTPGGTGQRGRKRKSSMGASGTPKKRKGAGKPPGRPKGAKGRRGSRGSSGSRDEETTVHWE